MDNLATVIIDMQDYFLEIINEDRKKEMIDCQSTIIEYSVDKKIPIFLVESEKWGKTTDTITKLLPSSTEVFKKMKGNAFENIYFIDALENSNIKNIFCMGVYSNACVPAFAAYSSMKYGTYTSDDTITSTDREYVLTPDFYSRKSIFMAETAKVNPNFIREKITYLENIREFMKLYSKN